MPFSHESRFDIRGISWAIDRIVKEITAGLRLWGGGSSIRRDQHHVSGDACWVVRRANESGELSVECYGSPLDAAWAFLQAVGDCTVTVEEETP